MNAYIITQIETQLAAATEECTAAFIARDMAAAAATAALHRKSQLYAALDTLRSLTQLGVRITDD